jgi:hypothetical protein
LGRPRQRFAGVETAGWHAAQARQPQEGARPSRLGAISAKNIQLQAPKSRARDKRYIAAEQESCLNAGNLGKSAFSIFSNLGDRSFP